MFYSSILRGWLKRGNEIKEQYDVPPDFGPTDVDLARQYALDYIRQLAAEAEAKIDSLISGNYVRAIMLNTEIVAYYQAGRPATPAANVYVIANALAMRRGIALREMLEILFDRWRNVQAKIALIITELDRLTIAIEAAQTNEEIEAVLVGVNFIK